MKKLISILLTLALILSFSATAFATTLVIADDTVRTYDGYKLLDLTVSLKAGAHPEGCDGTNHKDGCYNYAYTVNETYKEILQELAGKGNDIIEYLTNQSSDSDSGYGTLRDVAETIYDKIKGMEPDESNLTGSGDEIDQGYWLFADVTDLEDENEANSLVIVDTAGQDPVIINPKTALPTVEKKVKDINDSDNSDANIDDNAWQDSADHDFGDTVPFKLTATLPSNFAYYDTYQIVFHDTLSAGLTLKPETIKVLMYANKDAAEADVDTKNITTGDGATDVTTSFTSTSGNEFTVSCGNVKAITGVTKDTVFVVYYEATLNENAVIGAAGNPNEVYLEFSNNPYDEGTGKTEEDKVVVFTYKLIINKTDAEGKALKGAGFTLYKKNSNSEYVPIGGELVGNDMTTFEWTGLDDGEYKLEETTVPDGYNKMADIEFTITAEHTNDPEELKLTSLSGGVLGNGEVKTGAITKAIENKTGTVLPETGAQGTLMLITISTMLVIVACVFMITRKKMSIYED